MTDHIQRFPGAEKPHVTFDPLEAAFVYLACEGTLKTNAFAGTEGQEIAESAMAKLGTLLGQPGAEGRTKEALAKGLGFHAYAD